MKPAFVRSAGRALSALALTALVFALAAPAVAVPAQQQREVRRTFPAAGGMSIDFENLAGEVTIEGTGGSEVEVVATVHAESGGGVDAQALLDMLEVSFEQIRGRLEVRVDYPIERFDTYRYPGRGGSSFNTTTTYQGERVTVTSRDDRDAVALWVDVAFRIPAGTSIDVENSAGDVSAVDVEGDVRVDTGSGAVRARGINGSVEADTGSGRVEVEDSEGYVLADTGSGSIVITNVRGDVDADTGSGQITFTDVEGPNLVAGTGSGTIELIRVSGDIYADTGSGNIIGRDIVAGASLSADTGSGDVRFEGDLSGARQISIDTSSGDVELELSDYPGMSITIETGSGRIDVDLPDLQVVRSRRNYFRGTVGDGSADVVIDTGSGDVRIRRR